MVIARTPKLAEGLASIEKGSTVEVLAETGKSIALAVVEHKNQVQGLEFGVYYGLRLLVSQKNCTFRNFMCFLFRVKTI